MNCVVVVVVVVVVVIVVVVIVVVVVFVVVVVVFCFRSTSVFPNSFLDLPRVVLNNIKDQRISCACRRRVVSHLLSDRQQVPPHLRRHVLRLDAMLRATSKAEQHRSERHSTRHRHQENVQLHVTGSSRHGQR